MIKCALQTNMIQIKHNRLRIPTGGRLTSWLFTKLGGVEFGATENKSIQWQGGGFEPGTSGLQVQRPTTRPRSICLGIVTCGTLYGWGAFWFVFFFTKLITFLLSSRTLLFIWPPFMILLKLCLVWWITRSKKSSWTKRTIMFWTRHWTLTGKTCYLL